jgi:hypothetical protein
MKKRLFLKGDEKETYKAVCTILFVIGILLRLLTEKFFFGNSDREDEYRIVRVLGLVLAKIKENIVSGNR